MKYPKSRCAYELTKAIVSFTYIINVSQGRVATQFTSGGRINNRFIANFPQSMSVKQFLKWVIFGEDMDKSMVTFFFDSRCIISLRGRIWLYSYLT